jgi:hypothetical protein
MDEPPEFRSNTVSGQGFQILAWKEFCIYRSPCMSQALRLIDPSRAIARVEHLSLRTVASNLADIKAFLLVHKKGYDTVPEN